MKIAMVSEQASPLQPPGGDAGAGQVVHVGELAAALAGQGHSVTVYTRRADPGASEVVNHESGYRLEHVPGGAPEPLPVQAHLPHLSEIANNLGKRWLQERPDVVHAHFWTSGMVSLAATRDSGVPVVQTFHSLAAAERHAQVADGASPGRSQLEHVIATSVARTIATSAEQLRDLVRMGVPRRQVTVLPCGVDTERFSPGPSRVDSSARLVSLGRLAPHKGFDLQIRALRRVPGAQLWIGGSGGSPDLASDPEAIRLRGLAEQLGVADRVRLLGPVARTEVPALLRSATIVTTTPWYASFGLVALEGMACGVPVIASAVGGHLDTVIDGVTGVLVPSNRADAVAIAVNRLLDDPVQCDAFGVAAADRARSRYSWDRIAADTARVYEAVLGGGTEDSFDDEPDVVAELSH